MLSANALKMYPYQSTDLISETLDNRLTDIEADYASYLSSGYTLVTMTSSQNFGIFSSSALTSGSYVAVWRGTPATSQYTMNSSYFSHHTAIHVLGIQISTQNSITDYGLDLYFSFPSSADYSKLTLKYGVTPNYTGGSHGLNIDKYKISANGLLRNPSIQNSILYVTASTVSGLIRGILQTSSGTATISNILKLNDSTSIDQLYFYNNSTETLTISNIYFKGDGSSDLTSHCTIGTMSTSAGALRVINFDNAGGDNVYFSIFTYFSSNLPYQNNGYHLYFNNLDPFTGSLSNYSFKNKTIGQTFIYNNLDLNVSSSNFTDLLYMDADFDAEYVTDQTLFGKGTRLFYRAKFRENTPIDDDLKKFGDGWDYVIQREDFEYNLVSTQKWVKNYMLYTSSGAGTAYDYYQNDENFLMLLNSTSAGDTFIQWFGNQPQLTIFGDLFPDTVYQIKNCFQIWQPDTRSNLKNVIPDTTTRGAIPDSPMSGEVRFNLIDNEVL